MVDIIPQRETKSDDKFGNHYTIVQVQHTTGAVSDITVDLSAATATELAETGSGLAKGDITITDPDLTDGDKVARIGSGVATGTYIVCIRHIGNAAGVGSAVGAKGA